MIFDDDPDTGRSVRRCPDIGYNLRGHTDTGAVALAGPSCSAGMAGIGLLTTSGSCSPS